MQRFIDNSVVPSAAWPTRVIAYPIGARVAYCFYKLGFSPNAVSVVGLLISLLTVACVYFISNPILAGLTLFLGLEFSYIIDCSDGVLARATGKTSPYGALLDKLCDGIQTLVIPLLLLWIMDLRGAVNEHHLVPMVIFWVLSSSLLTHTIWLKPFFQNKNEETKSQNQSSSFFAKSAGFLIDNPISRLGIALAWALEGYAHFVTSYAGIMLFVFAAYLTKQFRTLK